MRYMGYIHRLCIQLEKENLTKEELIDKIYEIINTDKAITEHITRMEIRQVMECRGF